MKPAQGKGKGNRAITTTGNRSDLRRSVDKNQDTYFSYNMTLLIGCRAEITTRNGNQFEGVFVAYYSQSQEIMLQAAHLIASENEDSDISTHYDSLIIPADKLVVMKFENADLQYATKDFQTDTAISSNRNAVSVNRELTPWDGGETDSVGDLLDLGESDAGKNGWAPREMFKKNAEKYGIVSSYDQQLSGYTTTLDKSDEESFKKHEEQASQIAEEIENNSESTERNLLENGSNEEEKFSAVVREQTTYSTVTNNNNNISVTSSECSRIDKYVPPSRRMQNQTQTSTPPTVVSQVPTVTNVATSQAPMHHVGSNTRKPNYSGTRNTYSTTNSFYSDQRRSFERRVPSQAQYGPGSHGDGGRSTRGGKTPGDRRPPRDDQSKKDLMELHPPFNNSETSNIRRQTSIMSPNNIQHPTTLNHGGANAHQQQRANAPTTTTPAPVTSNSNNKINSTKAEEKKDNGSGSSPVTEVLPIKLETSTKVAVLESPNCPTKPTVDKEKESQTLNPSDVIAASPDKGNDPVSFVGVLEPRTGSEFKTVESSDASKPKPFPFNVNAKEFNPQKMTSRSPATPPRPPSTPASTPQLMPLSQGHPSYIQLGQGGPIYLAQPPPYSQNISPVVNTGLSTNNIPPQRHMNPHRKTMGVSQRGELPPAIPVQAAGPLLAQAGLQNSAPHPQFAYTIPHQHGYTQSLRIHAPNMVPMYNSEAGGEGNPIHIPLHYIHSGAPTGVHAPTAAAANAAGPSSIIPGGPHGYSQTGGGHGPQQHQIGYQFGLPVLGYTHHTPTQLIAQPRIYEQPEPWNQHRHGLQDYRMNYPNDLTYRNRTPSRDVRNQKVKHRQWSRNRARARNENHGLNNTSPRREAPCNIKLPPLWNRERMRTWLRQYLMRGLQPALDIRDPGTDENNNVLIPNLNQQPEVNPAAEVDTDSELEEGETPENHENYRNIRKMITKFLDDV